MLAVTRPGGLVWLEHASHEGANQRYRGLHQWDLEADGDHLVLGDRRRRRDLTVELAEVADVWAEVHDDGWVRAELRPHPARPS
jgi:hypothetical protein